MQDVQWTACEGDQYVQVMLVKIFSSINRFLDNIGKGDRGYSNQVYR